MMPKESPSIDFNEVEEIQAMKDKNPAEFFEESMEYMQSQPGPSSRKRKLNEDERQSKTPELNAHIFPPDDFVSFKNGNSNPVSQRRKDLRHTIDNVQSSVAMDAQRREQERLKRIEQQQMNKTATYEPVPVFDVSSDDEDDIQVLAAYKKNNAEIKHNGYSYPRRIEPPVPFGAVPYMSLNNMPYNYVPPNMPYNQLPPQMPPLQSFQQQPPNNAPVVDARTRSINKAREEEEVRLQRHNNRNTDLESVEKNKQGRLLVNFGKPDEDPDVFVAQHLTDILKPHQLGGIRFMYDNIIESVQDYPNSPGFGCVLAHSMGLGKSLQICAFIDIFFRTVEAKHVLIISPVNVIQNWMAEFNKWLPKRDSIRNFDVYLLGDTVKSFEDRRDMILSWRRNGGVLLMGYDMYRIFVCTKTGKQSKTPESKKVLKQPLILIEDDETENQRSSDCKKLRQALVDPGPDLIVCDEGHKIKCLKTSVSTALNQVRTKRRIVLTGYPLQNNLVEYFCMVDFVRPNYLGTKKEFSAMFDRPIRNGQCLDSTQADIKRAQMKIHSLTKMLKGFVQRRSAHLLKKILPDNKEYVLILRKTPIQHALYRDFVQYTKVKMYSQKTKYYNPLKAHAIGTKIWNHPDLLYYAFNKQRGNAVPNMKSPGNLVMAADRMRLLQTNLHDYFQIFQPPPPVAVNPQSNDDFDNSDDEDMLGGEITYDWAENTLTNYEPLKIEHSNKLIFAIELLKETAAKGEKILLFSASLLTLNLIENILTTMDFDMKDEYGNKIKWRRNSTYCRFDGSTAGIEREKIIDKFNSSPNQHLFLISTRAGSLGINLVSANRVIIFDASWNPCHDAQAVCRVYRYGQQKKTYVYRLVMHNSMERAIFYRQISKHGLQKRIVDEMQVAAKVTTKQLEDLLQYDESLDVNVKALNPNEWDIEDEVLQNVAQRHSLLIAEAPFLHESTMLESEGGLSEQEKIEAELLYKAEMNGPRFDSIPGPSNANSNIGINLGYDPMLREYYQQNMAFRGSLNELQRGVEFSDLGLNPVQFKITDQNSQSIPRPPPLHHPLHGGSMYRMNNAPIPRVAPSEPSSKILRNIEEDIDLPVYQGGGRTGRLNKGEQVIIIKMSDKIYLRKSSGGDIYDASNTIYAIRRLPPQHPPEVIELD